MSFDPKAQVPDWMPKKAHKFEELKIPPGVIEGLILKFVKRETSLSNKDLAARLKISMNIVGEFTSALNKRKMLDAYAPPNFVLTAAGKELADMIEKDDAYTGPCPVTFEEYCRMVVQQSEKERRFTLDDVRESFADYVIPEERLQIIKEGFNSQRPMLFFGPPGNGKSMVTHCIHNLLKDPVLVPHAFVFAGKCVRVFDISYHKPIEDLYKDEKAFSGLDERWVVCKAPLVVVGTEFRIEHFDISFDGTYDAPPHVKANNGIFVLDDLGRQAQDHTMILNQFIYPLENRQSIIKMHGGSNMRVPYRQRLFLSTNLNKEDIIDDAFNRRLLYQVLVAPPNEGEFKQIFINTGKRFGIQDEAKLKGYADRVVSWYRENDYGFRACDPRNLFVMLEAKIDPQTGWDQVLNEDTLREVYERYPKADRKQIEALYALNKGGDGKQE